MSSDHEEGGNKRQRVSRACDFCRRKKVKCDGLVPVCTNCKEYESECTYKDTTKKRGPPKGYVEAIENRLHKLESLLGEMAQGDDPKAESLLHELNSPLETPTGERIYHKPQRRAAPNSDRNKVFMWQQNSPVQPKERSSKFSDDQSSSLDSSTMNANKLKLSPISDIIRGHHKSVDTTGQLAMDNGQYRYLGKSSGFYLLQQSRTYHHGAFHLSANQQQQQQQQRMSLYSGSQPPFTSIGRPTNIDPLTLPSPELSAILIQLYFRHFYPMLPMFFKKRLSSSLDDPAEPVSPLLLNAIYAVASRICDDPQVRSNPNLQETAGELFFERAKLLLDSQYDIPRISTVQALLLLSSHQQGTRKSARAWLYSGMAFRMALDLGLNRDCEHWQIPPDEKERRKRVFWCCFICDKTASATYGRSSIFEESDCDVPFPTIDDDEPVFAPNANTTISPPGPLMVLTHLVSICNILGHVLKNIYYAKALQNTNMHHISQIVSSLTGRLAHWYRHLPLPLRIEDTNQSYQDIAYPICVSQLHMVYHGTVILLHRLFIPSNVSDTSPESIREYNICVESATSIMNIANGMLKNDVLKYAFHSTVYFIFTAGIIFVNSASSNDATTSFDAKVSINNIMRLLEALESIWASATRSANILGELAGLRDINLPTSENTLPPIVHQSATNYASKTSTSGPSPRGYYSATSSSPMDTSGVDIGIGSSTSAGVVSYDNDERKANQHSSRMMDGFSNNTLFNNNIQESDFSGPSQQGIHHQQQQQQQHSFSKGNMDPFAAPDSIPASFPQRQFDLSGAAFWGVPPSLDLADWNHYLGTQLPTYQQQQQQMTNVSAPSISPPPSSTNTPSSSSTTTTTTQPQLIPSRNIPPPSSSSTAPPGPFTSMMYATAQHGGGLSNSNDSTNINNSNSTMLSSAPPSTTATIPMYNRRPSSFAPSTLSPGTRSTQKHLIHSDANVDILSGMPIPLDLPDAVGVDDGNGNGNGNSNSNDNNATSLFGFLGDQQGTTYGGYGASDLIGDPQPRSTDFYGGDMIYY